MGTGIMHLKKKMKNLILIRKFLLSEFMVSIIQLKFLGQLKLKI